MAAAAVPSLFVVAGRSGGFVRGSGRFTVSWCKGVFVDVKGFGRGKSREEENEER